jgi:hypothetical protein
MVGGRGLTTDTSPDEIFFFFFEFFFGAVSRWAIFGVRVFPFLIRKI